MMERPSDAESYSAQHKAALHGRRFILKVCMTNTGKILEFQNRMLMVLVAQLLSTWCGKATWAGIWSFEGKPVIEPHTVVKLWAANRCCFGVSSTQMPFIVRGPTLNPTFIEEYTAKNILNAIDFATGWLSNCWKDHYWVKGLGPNGQCIISRREVEQMYHAEMRAAGWSITESVIQADGSLLGKKLSERRIV